MAFTNSSNDNNKTSNDERVSIEAANETTPLLAASPVAVASDSVVAEAIIEENESHRPLLQKPEDKPLPKLQIFLLCYARLIEPIAFFSIFPYINQMVQENGHLEEADVGFYAGLIESLFSLTQMLVMLAWGRAADRWGRKPVLVSSLVGIAISTSLFGLAHSIWQMIVLRCLAGIFAGTVVTIRTMLAEHSTPHTQARAFSWFAFSGNMGLFLGPLVGGALADPAHQYSGTFGGIPFFEKYPYALSSIVVGCIGLTAVASSALFLEETLHKSKVPKPNTTNPDSEVEAGAPTEPALSSTLDLLKAPGVGIVLYNYGHAMLLGFAYTAIVNVFWFTNPKLGGFGFSSLQISLFMGLTGLSQAIWLLVLFPPLQHRFGTNGVLRACGIAYPFFMVIMPFLNLILYQGTRATEIVFFILAPILVILGSGVSMAFTGVQLALNDVSPSPMTLGTLNALALTITSGLRAFCPVLFASLFAVSVKKQLLFGYLIWLVLAIIAVGFTVSTRFLPAASEKDYDRVVEEDDDEN
ncbi:MFS general substrate transporter [Hypoxylon trugodes]|uniref:MFS general substrate transporter n=1 Tax=Hypoxylon trugodes TaxID=326681 RepID=UPI00219DE44D|nr:MFS general substrate transporter [Hypoxylon trugodes]KAI1391708.1 MFS general substrate transporter [Hypoxylon trugodes]